MIKDYRFAIRRIDSGLFLGRPGNAAYSVIVEYGLSRGAKLSDQLTKFFFNCKSYSSSVTMMNQVENAIPKTIRHYFANPRNYSTRICSPRVSQTVMMIGLAKYEIVAVGATILPDKSSDVLRQQSLNTFPLVKEHGRYR